MMILEAHRVAEVMYAWRAWSAEVTGNHTFDTDFLRSGEDPFLIWHNAEHDCADKYVHSGQQFL